MLRTHDGRNVPVSQVIIAHKSSDGAETYLSTILRDLTTRNQAEALVNGQKQVLEMIAGGEPLTEIMVALLRFIEGQAPEMICSLLLLDEDGQHLRHCAAPSLPSEYIQATDGIAIGPRAGSSGTAAFRRSAVYVADIANDLLWTDLREPALAHGLRACWASPVFDVNHRLLGAFAVYSHTVSEPTERHRQLIDVAVHIAAICLSRHHAEQRLREQADMLSKAGNAIIVTDLKDRVTFWNQGAERVYGWTSAEAVGRHAEELFPPEDHPELNGALQASLDQRDQSAEIRLHNKSGQALVIEASATIIRDDQGQPKARLIISSDLTAKRKLEDQFFRAQRLESIGMLAAGIAHDLNNVLAPILLAAPMLRENATVPGDLRMIDVLEKSAERGAALVRQILSFAHGADGAHQLIQVKHLLRDLTGFIDQTFPKSIQLRENIPNDLWPVKGNSTQVHQILLNLCVNARDAMPQGGTLTVKAENCLLDETTAQSLEGARSGSYLVLHVEDSGSGIPLDILDRIWEPFFTTKATGKGTGLGLSTVRGIAENHGGFVTLRTALNVGTTFRVYLPAAEIALGKNASSNEPAPSIPRGQGQLILVVDDEPSIRKIATSMLASHGYRVLSAADGSEAVSLFVPRSSQVCIVITDLNMPNLDGGAFAAVVRRLNPAAKIIAISGLSLDNSDATRIKPVADAFLQKPFKPEDLLAMVHDLLKAAGAAEKK
jgi:PAS domain S-box-containing protein